MRLSWRRPAPPHATGTGGRIFGLDLMRATAILLVVAGHTAAMISLWAGQAGAPLVSYGAYYGIELFFVLSGYLIGGLLARQVARTAPGHYASAWRIFMARRWLRTLPLYYVWLGILLVLWVPVLPMVTRRELAHTLPAYLAMVQNLFWPIEARNFFDVSWSLAVEEWFYLLFASLLFVGLGRLRRATMPALAVLFVAVPVACRAMWPAPPTPGDHLVPYWLDSIGIGVWVALLEARAPRLFKAACWAAPLGALMLAEAMFGGSLARFGASTPLRQVIEVDYVAVAMALMLPALARWRDARGPLAWGVRQIAALSYAIYLVHLSVLVFVGAKRTAWQLSPEQSGLLSLAATLLIALALSYTIERPIMRRRPDDRRPSQASPASMAAPNPDPAMASAAPDGA